MSQRTVMIILILVIVLGGGTYAFKQLMPAKEVETQGPVYSTREVIRGSITVGVETTGMLSPTHGGGIRVPGEMRYDDVSVSYVIDRILIEDGDEVQKDQVLVTLQSPDIEGQLETKTEELKAKKEELAEMTGVPVEEINSINPSKGITVRAPIDGKINGLDAEEGDELQTGHTITTVVDDSRFKVRAKLTPIEINRVEVGQKVLLDFTYFDGFVDAQVTDINPNPIPNLDEDGHPKGFVHIVTIEGKNPGLVQPGMKARVGFQSPNDAAIISFFGNEAEVESFIKEDKVINRAEGIVTDVYVYEMQSVKKGDPIVSMAGSDMQEMLREKMDEIRELTLELNKLQARYEQMEIKASMDGVVASVNRQEGDTVRPGEWVGDIFNTGEMMMWVQVDDIDIVNVKQDAPVRVTVPAVPGETFEGKVTHISTMGENVNGITMFRVSITVKGGAKLRPGMQANAYIDAGSAEDVLLVPLEAVFEEDGKPMVEILNPDGTVRIATVKLGLMNDRYAEVKSGVEEGDLVITGSSADILPSEHIKAKEPILPDNNGDDDSGNDENNENR